MHVRILAARVALEQRVVLELLHRPLAAEELVELRVARRRLERLEHLLDARRDDQPAEDARQQRVGAQPVGAVVLVVALADGVQARDVRLLIARRAGRRGRRRPSARSRPTGRPSSSGRRGKSSSARRADRRPGTSRRCSGCRRACGRAPRAECASGRDTRTAGPASTLRPSFTQTSKISRVAMSRGTRLPYFGIPLFEEVVPLAPRESLCGSRGSCGLRGTHTRPPSPRADSLISRSLSAPGIAVGCTWMNSALPYLAPAWTPRLAAAAGAGHRHRAAAVDQPAAADAHDHRVGREGADLHRHQVLRDRAAAAAVVVEHRAEKIPALVHRRPCPRRASGAPARRARRAVAARSSRRRTPCA